MAGAFGGLLRSLGGVSQSIARAAPSVLRGVTQAQQGPQQTLASTPQLTQVRHRYFADRIAKGALQRNFGYKETLHTKGLLPHMVHSKRLPIKEYKPKNSWAQKRALFGQNDYIDILGNDTLKPTHIFYSVPKWLQGFKGNEYQMLLRKKKIFGYSMFRHRPTKFSLMNKRIRWLYRFLNQKTRDYYWKKA